MRCAFVVIALFLTSTRAAKGVDTFSVGLQAPDLQHLKIGSPITIDVLVTGLPSGASLDYLAATVAFPGDVLGTPQINAGSLVPDLLGFSSTAQLGLADALFDSLATSGGAKVVQSGTFFSFTVTPASTGAGVLQFAFTDALGATVSGDAIDGLPASESLPFVVEVPEPATLPLLVLSFLLARVARRRCAV